MELLLRDRTLVALGVPLLADPSVRLPDWFAENTEAARLLARSQGLLHHTLTEMLTADLHERGIPVVPLKGTALADSVHGELGARQSEDVDLLVRRDDLDPAVEVISRHGWKEYLLAAPPNGLPRLHRVLLHPTYPPVELHWRVHWYESVFSSEAIGRATPGPSGSSRLEPIDELAFLLLFFARDGFIGLRLAADLAAWWRSAGAQLAPGSALGATANRHPALAPALAVAARWTETLAGLEPGSLLDPVPDLSRTQRLALNLANPWLLGSRQQIEAEVSLIDVLLAPRGSLAAFARRALVPPAHEAILRDPGLETAPRGRLQRARAAHTIRVIARYALAGRRLGSSATAALASPSAK
jgi:hypothetical protein